MKNKLNFVMLCFMGIMLAVGIVATTYNIEIDLNPKQDNYIKDKATLNDRSPADEIVATGLTTIEQERKDALVQEFTDKYRRIREYESLMEETIVFWDARLPAED